MKLTLPYPPSVNHYWRHGKGRTYIGAQGRRFRQHIALELACQGHRPISGKLRVSVDLFPPDRRRRDIDNVLKALLDALEHARVYNDDAQIYDLHVRKHEKDGYPRAEVEIKEMRP